jgi:hypothetical protein
MLDTELMPPAGGLIPGSEEERRRRLIAGGGMPPANVRPLQPSSAPASSVGMPPANVAPIKRSEALPGNVMPPAPVGKATQRFQDLAAQGEPELHGWKKILDTVGKFLPFGKAVEREIPGNPLNYDKNLNEAAVRAAREQSLQKGEQEIQQAPAEADLRKRNVESEIRARGEKDSEVLAKQGLMRDAQGQIVADENSLVYKAQQQKLQDAEKTQQSVQALRESQKNLNDAREEVERAKNDPNSPAYKQAQQKLAMAQQAHAVAAQNLGLHQAEFANKLQEQELVKPSGQSQSRGSAAQAALDILPDLQQQIRKNAKELGPVFGRLAKGEIAIGNVDPKIAKLYSALTSFYALNPAIHGFRNFEFVKDMPSFIGGLERDAEGTIAGLEGLKPTLQSVAKEGKTYHKRVVEGRDENSPGGGETQVHNGFEYTKGADGQWHRGKQVQ